MILTWHNKNDIDVKIGGSFNNWELVPMQKINDVWQFKIDLQKGIHSYKFFINNNWFCNPNIPNLIDIDGNENNIIIITESTLKYINEENYGELKDLYKRISILEEKKEIELDKERIKKEIIKREQDERNRKEKEERNRREQDERNRREQEERNRKEQDERNRKEQEERNRREQDERNRKEQEEVKQKIPKKNQKIKKDPKEMTRKELLEFLGLELKDDKLKLIQKAYKKLSLKLHPDKNKDQDTTEDFKYLGNIYSILIEKFLKN